MPLGSLQESEVEMARVDSGSWRALAAVLAAAACGGGGGGGGPPSGSGGPWLPFSGWGVFAMDMSSPAAAPVTLDQTSNVGGLRLVQRGTYDPASGAVSGVEPYAAIWIAGGKTWPASVLPRWSPARRHRCSCGSTAPGRSGCSLLFQTNNKVAFTVSTSGTPSLVAVDKRLPARRQHLRSGQRRPREC